MTPLTNNKVNLSNFTQQRITDRMLYLFKRGDAMKPITQYDRGLIFEEQSPASEEISGEFGISQ